MYCSALIFTPLVGCLLRRPNFDLIIMYTGVIVQILAYLLFACMDLVKQPLPFFFGCAVAQMFVGLAYACTTTSELTLVGRYFTENSGLARGVLEV